MTENTLLSHLQDTFRIAQYEGFTFIQNDGVWVPVSGDSVGTLLLNSLPDHLLNRSVSVVNGEPICKPPKTKNSIRTIAIPHFLMERLAKWKADQSSYQQSLGDYGQGNNWVFIQSNGKMMNYSTPYETLHDAIARYNKDKPEEQALPMIPFHGLRHTSATLLIASNQDLKTVSRRMGHAQTSTTMNIYAHALRECDRNASDALVNLLSDS